MGECQVRGRKEFARRSKSILCGPIFYPTGVIHSISNGGDILENDTKDRAALQRGDGCLKRVVALERLRADGFGAGSSGDLRCVSEPLASGRGGLPDRSTPSAIKNRGVYVENIVLNEGQDPVKLYGGFWG